MMGVVWMEVWVGVPQAWDLSLTLYFIRILVVTQPADMRLPMQ